jgi:hypothetical protein
VFPNGLHNILFHLQQRIHDVPPRGVVPLPDSAFVEQARDSIPTARNRVTTATNRGRGRTRSNTRAAGRSARARKQSSTAKSKPSGKKRAAADNASTSGTQASQAADRGARSTTRSRRNHSTAPGSTYYWLFGDDQQQRDQVEEIPDLNATLPEEEEIPISQNAPAFGNM